MNLFVAGQFPNCIFVMAIEPAVVAAHIETAHRDLVTKLESYDGTGGWAQLGWRFLEKIVQLPLALPPPRPGLAESYVRSMFGSPPSRGPDRRAAVAAALAEVRRRDAVPALGTLPGERRAVEPRLRDRGVDDETARAVAEEVAVQRFAETFSDEDDDVRAAIVPEALAMPHRNPREMKRLVNLFRFYALIVNERRVLVDAPSQEVVFAQVAPARRPDQPVAAPALRPRCPSARSRKDYGSSSGAGPRSASWHGSCSDLAPARGCGTNLTMMSDTPSDSRASVSRAADSRAADSRASDSRADGAPDSAPAPDHPALHTRFCRLVGCRLPIVQTGMGWVSGASLTAATSAAGGFGILAAVTMTPAQFVDAVRTVKQRTDAPFGANFRADQPDLDDRIDVCVREGLRLVSFAGAPTKDAIGRLHDAGILVMPTVGARRHAEKMLGWGVDAVIAQGGEGGGHTGSVPTSLLLPQVVDAVGHAVPVLGAGGFHDGRGLVAALAWGADGVAMGTRFLLTAESRVPDDIKARYLAATVTDTVVTTALDGSPQRVIRTETVDRLERSSLVTRLPRALRSALEFRKVTGTPLSDLVREGLAMRKSQDLTWAQLAMAANAPMLIKAALVDGRPEVGVLPTGQVTGVVDELPTVADLLDRIVAEATAVLDRLASPGDPGDPGEARQ